MTLPLATLLLAIVLTCACIEAGRLGREDCKVCEETPCECHKLALRDDNKWKSVKKFVGQILCKIKENPMNREPVEGSGRRRCRHSCPKKQKLTEIVKEILNDSSLCLRDVEEQNLQNFLVNIIHPVLCETCCQPDPEVLEMLKVILTKKSECCCTKCPKECDYDRPCSDSKEFKYWFKTTKNCLRKEIPFKAANANEKNEKASSETNQVPHHCPNKIRPPHSKGCKTCHTPESLVCPRYLSDDSTASRYDPSFSICADCNQCKMARKTWTGDSPTVLLSCDECRAVVAPFVAFTETGHPVSRAETNARNAALRIRTDFVQINDFRSDETTARNRSMNPFRSKCDRLTRRRKRFKKICKN